MEKWGFKFGKIVTKVKPEDLLKTWRIVTGDIVEVVAGKDKGAQGKVIEVKRRQNRVMIEGLNLARKRIEGQTYYIEQGYEQSKLALLDPERSKPTKVKWGWVEGEEGGEIRRARISKLSGIEIPKPPPPVRERKPGEYDTKAEDAGRDTFVPSLTRSPIPSDCML